MRLTHNHKEHQQTMLACMQEDREKASLITIGVKVDWPYILRK